MNNPEPQNLSLGFVAWLDVLGFKQILSSGDGAVATKDKLQVWLKVWSILRKVQEQQFEHGLTDFLKTKRGLSESAYKSTAFTDSIVTSVDLLKTNRFDRWCLETLFLRRTAFLTRLMFEEGLPIRGGIAYGLFIHGEQGFAGGPFVEAETLSSRLELSACVFTRDAIKRVRRIHKNRPPWNRFETNQWWFHYDQCPVKPELKNIQCGAAKQTATPVCPLGMTSVAEPMYVLNFASRGCLRATNDASEFKLDFSSSDTDLRLIVTGAFSAHGKPVDAASTQSKIRETVRMLEAARSACPSLFS